MEIQKTMDSQSNLEKEIWSWNNWGPCLQTVIQSYSNQGSVVLVQKQNIVQWKKIESPEINSHTYGHWLYDKRGSNREKVSSVSGAGKTRQLHIKKWKYNTPFCITPYTKINSKWTKDLNVRLDTIHKSSRKTKAEQSLT